MRFYLLLILVAIIGYAPITILGRSMKNDMLNCYYKYFHIGECIQHGYLPLWNPFEFLGNPTHADLGGIAWSPIMWLWGLVGVNIYTLHLTFLAFIILGGWGMYRLSLGLRLHQYTSFLMGSVYMLWGFSLSSAQFLTWISSLAFIPFLIYYGLLVLGFIQCSNRWRSAAYFGIWVALMITTGYPAFLIILMYAFIIGGLLQLIRGNWRFILYSLLSLMVVILLSGGMLHSIYDVLPHLIRENGLPIEEARENTISLRAWLSYLFPILSTQKLSAFSADISMRNCYVGLFGILGCILFRWRLIRKEQQIIVMVFLAYAVVLLLTSLGDKTPVHGFLHTYIPLLNTFKHPALLRFFPMFACLLIGGLGLNYYLQKWESKQVEWQRLQKGIIYCLSLYSIVGLAAFFFLLYNGWEHENDWLYGQSIWFYILLQSVLQGSLLAGIYFVRHWRWGILLMLLLDIVVNAWIHMPYTVVGQQSQTAIANIYHDVPKDYPIPKKGIDVKEEGYGLNNVKKIISYQAWNGFRLQNIRDSYKSPHHDIINYDDYLFFASDIQPLHSLALPKEDNCGKRIYVPDAFAILPVLTDSIRCQNELAMTGFNPLAFQARYDIKTPQVLTLLQNDYKYWNVLLDGEPIKHFTSNYFTISVLVPKGQHQITFLYQPKIVRVLFIFSISAWIFCFLIVILRYLKRICQGFD